MITSIAIENLRGIAEGKLEGLAPLTILTGPNASGKSTVLDALLMGTSPDMDDAVGQAVVRHQLKSGGARWVKGRSGQRCQVSITDASDVKWARSIDWRDYCSGTLQDELVKRGAQRPFTSILIRDEGGGDNPVQVEVGFSADDLFVGRWSGDGGLSSLASVKLIGPGIPEPMHRAYSRVAKAGTEHIVERALHTLLPEFEELIILVGDGDIPELHVRETKKSVPLQLSGDGIQAFTQLVLSLASAPSDLLLVEEPEVYLHPGAIWKSAEILLETVRAGTQIVMTTHSLELIDALIDQASDDDLEKSALFTLGLEGGQLKSSRRAGADLAFARHEAETDLR